MKKIAFAVLTVVGLAAGLLNASPTALFSTLGPGDTYSTGSGWTLGSTVAQDVGNRFSYTGPDSYQLDSIELAAGLVSGTNGLDVWLMSDDGGKPGSIIESFEFTGAMGPFGQANPLLIGNSVSNPLLNPNTPYWLVAYPADETTSAAWNHSLPQVDGLLAYRYNDGPWSTMETTLGAFRINGISGSIIPAPGALLLGGIGVSIVGWLRRRRSL